MVKLFPWKEQKYEETIRAANLIWDNVDFGSFEGQKVKEAVYNVFSQLQSELEQPAKKCDKCGSVILP